MWLSALDGSYSSTFFMTWKSWNDTSAASARAKLKANAHAATAADIKESSRHPPAYENTMSEAKLKVK